MNILNYWKAVLDQDAITLRTFFTADASIKWHNTNERFNVEEFVQANCEYPGTWEGNVERVEELADLIITVVHVYSPDKKISLHATSFIKIQDGLIQSMDEYWGDDGSAPQWRLDKKIGSQII